jgi:hypothetical protein
MADTDGQELLEHFYWQVFATEEELGARIRDRSARVLKDTVQRLRKTGMTLERWVNFVHYGAE